MRKGSAGFALVEALLACAMLVLVLVPALGTLNSQLAAAGRMRTAALVDQTLAAQLDEAELRILADDPPEAIHGIRQPGGLLVSSEPPEAIPCGTNHLWTIRATVTDPASQFIRHGTRLVLHPAAGTKSRSWQAEGSAGRGAGWR